MRSEAQIHDHAWAIAHAMLDAIGHNYREEEQREIFSICYNAARAGLESFCSQYERMLKRICPSKN